MKKKYLIFFVVFLLFIVFNFSIAKTNSKLVVENVEGTYGGNVNLRAQLLDQNNNPLSSKILRFYFGDTYLNSSSTAADGWAVLENVPLSLWGFRLQASPFYFNFIKVEFQGDQNYNPTTSYSNLVINPKPLSVLNISAYNKIYDGTTTALLNFSSSSLEGLISGDEVYLSTSSYEARFLDKNAQENKQVNILRLELSGLDANNYEIKNLPTTTASIFKKALSVLNISAYNKIYDGTTTALLNFSSSSLEGLISGDEVYLSTSSYEARFLDKNAQENKQVNIIKLELDGFDKENYAITNFSSTSFASILPKEITIEGIKVFDKRYDGKIDAQIDFSKAIAKGILEGDDVDLDFSEANFYFEDPYQGYNKKVLIKNVKLKGLDKQNYYISNTLFANGNILPSYSQFSSGSYNNLINQQKYQEKHWENLKKDDNLNLKSILFLLLLILLRS